MRDFRNVRLGRMVVPAGILGLMLLQPAGASHADEQDLGPTYARVRYLDGGLTVQRTGEGEVSQASQNSPVAPGDSAWTDDGRAEIALADGSVIRLDGQTRLDLRSLADADNRYEKTNLIALEQGSVRIETSEPESSDKVFQIDTDGGSIYLLSGGSFRIDAEGSVSTVSSFRGVAELSGDGGSVLVRSGERSSVRRGRSPADPRPFNTLRLDDFDRFCEERGAAYLRHDGGAPPEEVQRDLPPEVDPYVGELSAYGRWHQVPDYGWVWRPVYSAGWGPYLYGDWVWSPTGWVWVSYDPWGWAPYHYGRWDFAVDLGWFWIPGRVWSGAWVSFAVGPSYIGWCPLNFYNRPVFTSVNVVNVTNVNVTRLDPRGWRFVPSGRFGTLRGERLVVRPDRLPRGTDVVVTGRLPRFDPREVATHPERGRRLVETVRASRAPLPAAVGPSGRPVPFRVLERSAEGGYVTRRGSSPRGQDVTPRGRGLAPRHQGAPPQGGPGFGGAPPVRRNDAVRERAARPARERTMPSAGPGASEPSPRTRSMDPRRSGASRAMPPTGRPEADRPGQSPREPAGERTQERSRPRDRAVERLFNGVRRDRAPAREAPPSAAPPSASPPRVAPPREQPHPPSPPPEARPRETPRRQERPPRNDRRH